MFLDTFLKLAVVNFMITGTQCCIRFTVLIFISLVKNFRKVHKSHVVTIPNFSSFLGGCEHVEFDLKSQHNGSRIFRKSLENNRVSQTWLTISPALASSQTPGRLECSRSESVGLHHGNTSNRGRPCEALSVSSQQADAQSGAKH